MNRNEMYLLICFKYEPDVIVTTSQVLEVPHTIEIKMKVAVIGKDE